MAFIKSCSTDSRNEQSPTCEVVHKAHFRYLLPNRFLSSSVVRVLESWSGGCKFKPHRGQFLTKFILFCVALDLLDNLTETSNVKNSKCLHQVLYWANCGANAHAGNVFQPILSVNYCVMINTMLKLRLMLTLTQAQTVSVNKTLVSLSEIKKFGQTKK